ncbi:uncharacterized protein LOC123563490 [Mercenaria mercenaria]|uniref:uncharacterized protein LOC123563490 n=1 Tax=Mercenaria mercenaria TaxID=6596 RepID=UPI00234ECA76|nr:uncharacterized protein LOC123563490 [Mercenaria mercenaria]XP_053388247.1 uncharacterized protein LOC123563490 [Mercenaria mercenaria]XP_053388252.1 uncharacterized protein LOC123563490 [Mercenaria mercenaria]
MSYAFPELNPAQICASLNELCNIDLQESWFKKPDPIQWQDICRKCLCEITGSAEDSFLQQHLLSTEFDYPEIHSESVPVMHLIEAMRKVMPSLYVNDFSGGDIITPTTIRLKKIFSAIINFLRFKHTRFETYEDIKTDIERDREHHDTLVKRNEELKQRINQIRAERAQQEPEIQRVQDEVEKKTLTMQEHHRNKQTIQMGIMDIKTRIAEKKAKVDQLKCAILKSKEDEDKLSQKIVQSPEKVRAEQEHLKEQLNYLKDEFERKRHRLGEIQEQRKRERQLGADAEKGLQILEAMQTSINKENEIQAEKTQAHDKILEYKEQEREMSTRKEQLQQMLSTRQEKLSKMSLQHQSRLRVLQEQNESLKNSKEGQLQKQNYDSERKLELLEYKKKKEQEVNMVQKVIEKQVNNIKEMYGNLLEKTDVYNREFGTKWDEIRQNAKQ